MVKKLLLLLLLVGTLLHATTITQENLTKLYIATFDRAPDAKGLAYWIDSRWQLEAIAISFFDQKETKRKYPAGFSLSDFIESIYQNLFDRDPDDEGFVYWLAALQKDKALKPLFILAAMRGALGDDARLLDNRVSVALAFVKENREDIDQAFKVIAEVTQETPTINEALCKYTLPGCIEEKEGETTLQSGGDGGGSTSVDISIPVITLLGDATVNLTVGDSYTDAGATASDDRDGDITSSITKGGDTVDITTAGTYTITYNVKDAANNSATQVTRTAIVAPAPELASALKKTGQTTEYAAKDDGTYQMGVAHSYTRNADDTVTDSVTGLIWQDNAVVADTNSKKSWQNAIDYCDALDFADSTEWRLPTIDELVYITDKGKLGPAIDTTAFYNIASSYYWSSTTGASDSSYAWGVYFNGGNDDWDDKSNSYFVRCVRAGQ